MATTFAFRKPKIFAGLYQHEVYKFPVTGSLTTTDIKEGDACILSSGLMTKCASENVVSVAAPALGFINDPVTATTVAGDLYEVALILPHLLFEVSQGALAGNSASAAGDLGTTVTTGTTTLSGSSGIFAVTRTGGDAFTPIVLGSTPYNFKVNAYAGKKDTSATAGQSIVANADMGVVTDLNIRVLGRFTPTACLSII